LSAFHIRQMDLTRHNLMLWRHWAIPRA
jgi:hypothetical protein